MCEVGSTPIVSRGDGTPGKCCDVFECVNGRGVSLVLSEHTFVQEEEEGGVQSSRFCLFKGRQHAQELMKLRIAA